MTTSVLFAVAGFVLGGVLAWLLADRRRQGDLGQAEQARVRAETQLAEAQKDLAEQTDRFKVVALEVFQALSPTLLEQHRAQLEPLLTKADGNLTNLVKPLQDELDRYQKMINAMEADRQREESVLGKGLETLDAQIGGLAQVLRNPQARGQWGELQLRNVVEMAGMSDLCDYDVQVPTEGGGRVDMSMRLPGGRCLLVDSKAPREAYVEYLEASDDLARLAALKQHARAVRGHVQELAKRGYEESVPGSLNYVLLFLPNESLFSAAVTYDPDLLPWAWQNRVIMCSPTSLLAVANAAALLWHQDRRVKNADQIYEASREFYSRLSVFVKHFGGIREGLTKANDNYNKAVRSWITKVSPQGRRIEELGGAAHQASLEEPQLAEVELHELPAGLGDAEPEETEE